MIFFYGNLYIQTNFGHKLDVLNKNEKKIINKYNYTYF